MIIDQIIKALESATGIKNSEVEFSANEKFGDYSSNIAMQMANEKGNFLENIEWFWKNIKKNNFSKYYDYSLPIGKLNSGQMTYLRGSTFAKIRGFRDRFEGHPEITIEYFRSFPYFLRNPEHYIKLKKFKNRFLLVGHLSKKFSIVVEIDVEKDRGFIVSTFMVKDRYLKAREANCVKHKKIGKPARTAVSSILAPEINQSGGSRFSTLQDTYVFYNKFEAKSQGSFLLNYEIKRNPREFATEIISKIKSDIFEKIEVAGGGFINFWLKKDILVDNLIQIDSQKEDYGKSDLLKDKKIMFEYGDANTHKLPHLGHLFSYTYGEATSRILAFAGANVRKACYQGDIGLHVAKCLWAFQKQNPIVPKTLDCKVELLQKLYQDGSKAFEDEKIAEEIKIINKEIYDSKSKLNKLWRETRQWSIDYYKKFEEELYINYDRYYYESEVYQKGQEIVEKNEGKVFKRSEGALIFEGSKYGLHDRVFVTKYGTPTYEAKDMYLQELKMQEWPMDLLIITTANEQNGYFDVIFKALETLDKKYFDKLLHIGFGMINLKTGKMSSRTGEILGAIDVIEKIKELSKEQNPDSEIAQKVAIGAIKYSLLKNNPLQNIAFDINESVAREGNSGPYIQYTIARINSVLAKTLNSKLQILNKLQISKFKFQNEELSVLRKLSQFQEISITAAKTYSPNILCNYLYELASKFNTFYNAEKIIGGENEDYKLLLTKSTGQVLKNGLKLLGIESPAKM
ncbi:MAG: arginine--tRNA ligase [Patescibacteria group bacterium]